MKKNSYTVILLVFFTLWEGYAAVSGSVVNIRGTEARISLNGKIRHYETADSAYIPAINDTEKFKLLKKNIFGNKKNHSHTYHWAIISFANSSPKKQTILLVAENPLIGSLQYYRFHNGLAKLENKTGDEMNFDSRLLPYHSFAFPVSIDAGDTAKIALRVHNMGRRFSAPLLAWTPSAYSEFNTQNDIMRTAMFGFFLFGVFINIALYFFTFDIGFATVSFLCATVTIVNMSLAGFGFQYFYPHSPQLHNLLSHLSPYLLAFAIIYFTRYYFRLSVLPSWVKQLLNISLWAIILLSLSVWLDSSLNLSSLLVYHTINTSFYISIAIGVWLSIKGDRTARFFLLGMSIYAVISILASNHSLVPVLKENILFRHAGHITFSLTVMFLTVAKFDRFRILRDEKEAALSESVKHLENLNRYKEEVNQSLNEIVDAKTREIFDKQLEVNKALVKGEEQERQRVSMELHDGLGSLLSVMKLNLSMIADDVQKLSPETLKVYENTLQLLNKSHEELRSISHNLMPPVLERYGLQEAILNLKEEIDSNIINIDFHFVALNERLPIEIEVTIYRIIQELIQNIIRHSGADKATIQLTKEETLFTIIAEDNGKGISQNDSKSGQGLSSMKNRTIMLNGTFTIDCVQQKGTTIIVEIPLQNQKNKV